MRGRGAGWVVAQSVLMACVAALCFVAGTAPPAWLAYVGGALAACGVVAVGWAMSALGKSLTPFPRPKPTGELVTRGPFRVVRHPIYGGLLLVFIGVSFVWSAWALVPTGALAVLWRLKAGVEERHLARAFPEYGDYARRVRRRFLPFVF